MILRGHKLPQQGALNRFSQDLGEVEQVPTASAYCQARQKLQPALFVQLNRQVVAGFYRLYEEDGEVRRGRGPRVVGIDGSVLNVPDTKETRAHYSGQANQHAGGRRVQALSRVCYDVLNDIGLRAALSKKQAEKQFIFDQHVAATTVGDVVVLDRGYADYAVMAFLVHHQREFVVRLPRGGFTAVQEFWASGAREHVVPLTVPRKQRRVVRAHGWPCTLSVRLVRVELEGGEVEVLGTSLLDAQAYPWAEFKQVYGWRWGSETYHDRIKNIFEVERFSGRTVGSIEQDFYGVMFLATLAGVLSKSAEAELVQESAAASCKYEPQVNHALSYLALVDHTVALLLDPHCSVERTLGELHHLFKTNPSLRRPGRKAPRKKASASRQLWFHRYTKRVLA